MGDQVSWGLRWARAGVLASVACATGVLAHVGAGGMLPAPPVLLLMVAVTTGLLAPLMGRRLRTSVVAGLVVGGQTVVHAVLSLLAGHRAAPEAVADAVHHTGTHEPALAGHHEHVQSHLQGLVHVLPLPEWAEHLVGDALEEPMMALLHLVAAAAVGLWLGGAEQALWALLTHLGTASLRLLWAFAAPVVVAPATPVPRRQREHRTDQELRSALLGHAVARRGPPALLTAVA